MNYAIFKHAFAILFYMARKHRVPHVVSAKMRPDANQEVAMRCANVCHPVRLIFQEVNNHKNPEKMKRGKGARRPPTPQDSNARSKIRRPRQ